MSQRKPSLYRHLMSILAAAFGVQSEAARTRDFASGSPFVFIAGGMGFVAVFVGLLLLIVQAIVGA